MNTVPLTLTSPTLDKVPVTPLRTLSSHGEASHFPIGDDGRIILPGLPAGLTLLSYLPLVHLYASIQEASRILDRFRPQLCQKDFAHSQRPITALDPSLTVNNLFYKREDQTVTKAYKVRGAVTGMAKAMESQGEQRFLTVSTGNHALGVLKAAELLKPQSIRIVVPENTAPLKLEKIQSRVLELREGGLNASVLQHGNMFDEARNYAFSLNQGEMYLDPYSDPWVVAGQGTIGLELVEQILPYIEESPPKELLVIAPVGGGGLLTGISAALRFASSWDSRFQDIHLRFLGLRLADINSIYGDAIRVAELAPSNKAMFQSMDVNILPVDDAEIALGMQQVHEDLGMHVEGASGATLYPLTLDPGAYAPSSSRMVILILSGGNV